MTEQGSMEHFLSIFSSDRNDKTSRLAEKFYGAVRTGRFTWMGLGETAYVLERRRLVIYLVEGSAPQTTQASTSDSFVPLNLDLRSRQKFLDLYFLSPQTNKSFAESAVEDMNARYSSHDHDYQTSSRLLFEETIIPPVFY